MLLVFPNHRLSGKLNERIKNVVLIFALLLLVCAVVGLFLFLSPDPDLKTVGACLLFIPLGIMGVQITAGIVLRIVGKRKRR